MEDRPRDDHDADGEMPDTSDAAAPVDEPADGGATTEPADRGATTEPADRAAHGADGAAATAPADLDATRVGPPLDPDATQVHPAVDDSAGAGMTTGAETSGTDPDGTRAFDADATRAVPKLGDTTADLPPGAPRSIDDTAVAPPVPEGWQGRATVRPAGPYRPPTAPEGPDDRAPGRAWWLPILLGVLGLLLIVGLAYGLVVATRHHDTNPTPAPTHTPTTVAPSTPPTTAPPTTSAPPSTAPAQVTVPADLTSKSLEDAESELSQLKLTFQAIPQTVSDPSQVGMVIAADPAPGSTVPVGTQVTLTYGVAPASPSSAPSAPSAAPSPSQS
ncbi:MAG TPA: PASTA domain-containing protein [Micromonosporaceae bacterium]|nr:PASTA domain-containing protein [Micromonosporaceae bacterium]